VRFKANRAQPELGGARGEASSGRRWSTDKWRRREPAPAAPRRGARVWLAQPADVQPSTAQAGVRGAGRQLPRQQARPLLARSTRLTRASAALAARELRVCLVGGMGGDRTERFHF
jgi:hypothetical protein